jgi:hypothetical protein
MKKSIALFCFALCAGAGAGSAAQAANNSDAFCTQLSSDITARSALFLKVAVAAPDRADSTPLAPAAVPQAIQERELALHNIANEIWSLRTRMAHLNCTQASTFAY